MRTISFLLVVSAPPAFMGCTSHPSAGPLFTEHDSAGVTIIDNRDAQWETAKPWHVESRPRLTIGSESDDETYRFDGIRAVYRLTDGGYVVADGAESIRRYDSTGGFRSRLGRNGAGPGEFSVISMMSIYGPDSLVVWDFPARRVTILPLDGGAARLSRSPSLATNFFALGTFGDGSLLGLMDHAVNFRSATAGFLADQATYVRYDIGTGNVDTVTVCPGGESSYLRDDGTVVTVPFTTTAVVTASGQTLYCGSGASFEIREYSETGAPVRVLRLDRKRPLLPKRVVQAYLESEAGRLKNPKSRARFLANFSDLPYPERLPAYHRLLVDAVGNLWVAGYMVTDTVPTLWTIFDPRGHILGNVETPGNYEVMEIGSDYILGVATDSLGIEQIQEYKLVKGN